MTQTFSVAGLNCQSCVNHVTGALAALDSVQRVTVDLEPKATSLVHIEASRQLGDDEVQAALAEEGNYVVVR